MLATEVLAPAHHRAGQARGQIAVEAGIELRLRPVALDDVVQRFETGQRLLDERVAEPTLARFAGQISKPVGKGQRFCGRRIVCLAAQRYLRECEDQD